MNRWLDRIYSFPPSRHRILAMEGLRGYAVLCIFFVHVSAEFLGWFGVRGWENFFQLGPRTMLVYYLHRSHYGVDLFFLISGFLIFNLLRAQAGHFRYGRFLARRFLRIYPAYLVGLALYIPWVTGPLDEIDFSWPLLLQNLLLLNGIPELRIYPFIHVSWSLFFELAFYILFPMILLLRPLGILASRWKMALYAAAWAVVLYSLRPDVYARCLMFFAGVFIAMTPDSERRALTARIPDSAVLAIYLATTALYAFFRLHGKTFTPLYFIPACLLFTHACFGRGFLNRLFEMRWLRYMGNISYSLYLMHVLAIWWVEAVMIELQWIRGTLTSYATMAALSFTVAWIVSTLMFVGVEKWYFRDKPKIIQEIP